jgi:hypothetical protein
VIRWEYRRPRTTHKNEDDGAMKPIARSRGVALGAGAVVLPAALGNNLDPWITLMAVLLVLLAWHWRDLTQF